MVQSKQGQSRGMIQIKANTLHIGELDNVRSTTVSEYILTERGGDMANVIITTYDGKVYTNPEDIKVERNENTEMFYRFLEQYRDERIQKREDTA